MFQPELHAVCSTHQLLNANLRGYGTATSNQIPDIEEHSPHTLSLFTETSPTPFDDVIPHQYWAVSVRNSASVARVHGYPSSAGGRARGAGCCQ
jgi:hypothetical protein